MIFKMVVKKELKLQSKLSIKLLDKCIYRIYLTISQAIFTQIKTEVN